MNSARSLGSRTAGIVLSLVLAAAAGAAAGAGPLVVVDGRDTAALAALERRRATLYSRQDPWFLAELPEPDDAAWATVVDARGFTEDGASYYWVVSDGTAAPPAGAVLFASGNVSLVQMPPADAERLT